MRLSGENAGPWSPLRTVAAAPRMRRGRLSSSLALTEGRSFSFSVAWLQGMAGVQLDRVIGHLCLVAHQRVEDRAGCVGGAYESFNHRLSPSVNRLHVHTAFGALSIASYCARAKWERTTATKFCHLSDDCWTYSLRVAAALI